MAQPDLPGDSTADTSGASGTSERPGADERPSGERAASRRPAAPSDLAARVAGALRAALSAKTRVGLLRRALAPLLLALVPLFWVADATHRASLTTLGRDQGIFQYTAWAIGRGEVLYRDIRDVNGPLIHLIHAVLLALGGADEHRFHLLDLWITGLSFAFVGACIPGLVARSRPKLLERAAWGAAAAVVLGAQYHLYLYWDQAQRESFCDWFLLPSLALQVAWPATTARSAGRRVVAIAALSTVTWFGKPSFGLFTVVQLGVLMIDRDVRLSWKGKLAHFVLGGALGAAIPLAYLFKYGDAAAFARIAFVDVPQIYRFIWAKSAQEIFGEEGPLRSAAAGVAASAVLLGLVGTRALPRRVLVVAFAPLCGMVNVIVQKKGFGYHFHPLTATTHMGFVIVVAMLWERFRGVPHARPLGRYAALAATVAYAAQITTGMHGSPHLRNVWILAGGETAERRTWEEYFNTFKTHDFFPWALRKGAEYVRDKTSADARVQVYGMDPYLLFLAQRRSATPYIYAYDLNAAAALEGGWSSQPTELDTARINAARDAHEADMLARLKDKPPEAFVFIDRSPLITYQDAWEDFQHACPKSAEWVQATYRQTKALGEVHVWLRNDLPD